MHMRFLILFLIPEHKCNIVKMFRSIARFFPIFSIFFPPFIIAFCWLLGGVDQISKQINKNIGARKAIESFQVDQALEMLLGPFVTILARDLEMRLKFFAVDQRLEMLRMPLVTIWALEMRLKVFQVDQRLEMLRVVLVTTLARKMLLKSF